jgi:hypothetical protein
MPCIGSGFGTKLCGVFALRITVRLFRHHTLSKPGRPGFAEWNGVFIEALFLAVLSSLSSFYHLADDLVYTLDRAEFRGRSG